VRRARLDDGLLDVRIVDAEPHFSRTRVFLATALGLLSRSKVYERFTTPKLSIHSCEGPLRLACDGETFESSTTFVIEKNRERLHVFAPAACAAEPSAGG
jgi:undecaprenyl-diphosphatase